MKKSLHFSCNDQILTGIITLNDLKTADIKDSELEGINSYVDQVEGTKIGVTIRELPDGNTRCSMRTSGNISANEICQFFGGGECQMLWPNYALERVYDSNGNGRKADTGAALSRRKTPPS